MDFEKDLFEQFDTDGYRDTNEIKQECVIVDKVFDSCFQRECEPSKVVTLPAGEGPFRCSNIAVTFGPGFIVDDTLQVTPIRLNFARVRFTIRIPFTLTVTGTDVSVNDFVEFAKDIEVFLPQSRSEFSFDIILETRSDLLRCEVIGNQVLLSIGSFVVTKVVGRVQLLIPAFGYCPAPRECQEFEEQDVCRVFDTAPFPQDFFPPQMEDIEEEE